MRSARVTLAGDCAVAAATAGGLQQRGGAMGWSFLHLSPWKQTISNGYMESTQDLVISHGK